MIHKSVGSITFYITNVCNLNCQDCSYLNNYPVKGHQRWADNAAHCERWSQRFDPVLITVLGGEPMSNPDFLKWIHGIADLWPYAEIRVVSNGTMFDRWPTLYDEILPYRGRVNISISGHNEHKKQAELATIRAFLRGPIQRKDKANELNVWRWYKIYGQIKDASWPDVDSLVSYDNLPSHIRHEIEHIHGVNIYNYVSPAEPVPDFVEFVDENKMRVGWANWNVFFSSSVKFDPESQRMTLHNSDPDKAIKACHGGACAYIKDGKYYKCEVMGILPDMLAQGFPFDISEQDKQLILSYEPADADWSDQKLDEFVKGLQNRDPIPQCKFCPETKSNIKIFSSTKKIKIHKMSPQ